MIKCTLIEVDNDNRAVIIVGDDPHGEVKTTRPLEWIEYSQHTFRVADKIYEFTLASDPVA